MTHVTLRAKGKFTVPVDASAVSPDSFAGKAVGQIELLEAWEGNVRTTLGSIFDVGEGPEESAECAIAIEGDTSKLRRMGKGMASGSITVNGDAGLYVGEAMRGGSITVNGDAGSWLGTRMRGGTIEVKGDAGDYIGSAYRGSRRGMNGGQILVHGDAGNEVGCWMKKGLIRIKGNAGQFAGMHMSDGTILIGGNSRARAGAGMTGGRIVILGEAEGVPPSFSIDEIRNVMRAGEERLQGPFYVFVGDLTEGGEGKVYALKEKNPHLQFYEAYLE
jgi:formylmethanofuran dehydrogenase subunit C